MSITPSMTGKSEHILLIEAATLVVSKLDPAQMVKPKADGLTPAQREARYLAK